MTSKQETREMGRKPCGTVRAISGGMSERHPVATNHREVIVWQRCAELRRMILKLTRREPVRSDRKYTSQIRSAARSSCYLISEGFYRKRDGDFLNFLHWARGSIGETVDQIDEGLEQGYFSKEEHAQMLSLIKRAFKACRGFMRYLEESLARKKQQARDQKRVVRPVKWTWRKHFLRESRHLIRE